MRLAETLRVPLRERNALLLAAGYAPLYRDTALDAPELKAARHAVELFITGLEPNPVLVLDRYWNSLRMNAGAKRILSLFPGCDSGTPHNGVRLVFDPKGLRPFIENWETVAARIIRRIHREAIDNPFDERLQDFFKELLSYPGVPRRWHMLDLDGALNSGNSAQYQPLPFSFVVLPEPVNRSWLVELLSLRVNSSL